MLKTNLHPFAAQIYPLLCSPDGLSKLEYSVQQDVSFPRLHLSCELNNPEFTTTDILYSMLQQLDSLPKLELPIAPIRTHRVYLSADETPSNCLEQSFFILLTSRLTNHEAQTIDLLDQVYPVHIIYHSLILEVSTYERLYGSCTPLEAEDFTLSFKEQVDSYYQMAKYFSPMAAYSFPNFNDFSLKTEHHCHIVQRNGKSPVGVMWLEVLPNMVVIRLLCALKPQMHVLQPLVHKAFSYAKQRGKSKVMVFYNITTQESLMQQYANLGFKGLNCFLHYFMF